MTAYVLFMNDSPEAVVLDNEEKALEELKKLSKHHFLSYHHGYSKEEYSIAVCWHIHEVPILS